MELTQYHAKYFAYELTKRSSSDNPEKLVSSFKAKKFNGRIIYRKMEDDMIKSPDRELKERIIETIGNKGILNNENLKKLENRYMSTGMKMDDWILLVEKQLHAERENHEK